MATFEDIISGNKSQCLFNINRLMGDIRIENQKWFSSGRQISICETHIHSFRELIRASDQLSLNYSNVKSTLTDINSVGRIISNSVNNRNEIASYSFDNRFSILFELLNKRILKRDDFVNCINAYNDIVLNFLNLKSQEYFKHLNLQTISEIEAAKPTFNSALPTSHNYKHLSSATINKFLIVNDTSLNLSCSTHYKINNVSKIEQLKDVSPHESIVFAGQRRYYELLVSDKSKGVKALASLLTTIKVGYSYKIIRTKGDKLVLISN